MFAAYQQHHAALLHALVLVRPAQAAGAAHPVIAAEHLVDHEVAHGLRKLRVAHLGHQFLLVRREVHRVDMIEVVG